MYRNRGVGLAWLIATPIVPGLDRQAMDSSDSLHLDEHLARLLAAFDQGLGDGDGRAPTIDVPPLPAANSSAPVRGERAVEPISGAAVNQGPLSAVLPDSNATGPYTPHTPVATPPPSPGPHRIGRFELRRQLGKGGCGIVFLAYDPKLKREVALKIPRPEMLLSPDARRRLVREGHAAAGFDHPNLVPVYETGEIGPVCFIATAFCPGQTLADWLERQAFPVPVRQAARLVAQLAEAVQHAHDRGVLHRDLKPNNVILQETKADPNDQGPPPGACPLRTDHFTPRLVDFGLAKLADHGPGETVTRQILGTPKYMAPEQAQGRNEDVGPEADVYALGVILYEMLTGRTPYEGATDVEVLRQAVEGNLTPPRAVRSEIPRDLDAICQKAMARTPTKRYRTAIDLADDLRRFLEGLPTLARPLNAVGRWARWLRRNDQAFALAVVSMIAVILLPVGMWNVYQARKLRVAQDATQARDAERMRLDRQRAYARHVRDAFLSWRAGDARQMADSLGLARLSIDSPEFAWGYLAQIGRVERLSVGCPAGAAVALAVSPTGARTATGHRDGTLAIWDRQTGVMLGAVKAHPSGVTHVAFSADGTRLITAGGEASARVWSLPPKGPPTPGPVMPPLGSVVTALAVAGGPTAYVGSADGECACWDVAGNRVIKSWTATTGGPVTAIAVSPDEKTVAAAGRGEPIRLWDTTRYEPTAEVRGAAGATALVFARSEPAGWLLAAAGDDGTIRLFDRQGREVRTLPGHTGPVLGLAVSADGAAIASGGEDAGVAVWDIPTGSMRTLLRGHDQPVRGLGFGPDARSLYTASDDGMLKAWDLTADPEGPVVRGLSSGVAGVALRSSGTEFGIAYTDGSVELFPHVGGTPRRYPAEGRGVVVGLQFPEHGPPVGVELDGPSAVVWEFGPKPRKVFQAEVRSGSVATVAALAGHTGLLAVGDDRGQVTIWSLKERRSKGRFATGLVGPVRHLCFSDDGQWVAAQTTGSEVGVWQLADQTFGDTPPTPDYKVPGHGDGLWLVRFLPGGDRVVTAGRGSSIKVWRLSTGKEDLALLGHVGRVTGLAVSPDGRTLVSGSGTGEVKLWDLHTGLELVGLRRHAGPVSAVEFAADGKSLITGGTTPGGRGELAFWDTVKD